MAVSFRPFASAETLKACALTGLHLLAAEGEAGSSGNQSPDLGDMWRYGCPRNPGMVGALESSFELPHDHGPLPRNEGCVLG